MEAGKLELSASRRQLITSDSNGSSLEEGNMGGGGDKGTVSSQNPFHMDPIMGEQQSKVISVEGF